MKEILSRGGACAGWLAPSGDGSEELITISANQPEDLEITDTAGRILREPFQTTDEPYNKTVNDKLEQNLREIRLFVPRPISLEGT